MTRAKPGAKDSAQKHSGSSASKESGFKRFFDGISWSQLIASGLSALTVFLLTAKIGMAGSIIGAILASMVSTFSSQLYRNMLDISGDKLLPGHNSADGDDEEDEEGGAESGAEDQGSGARPSAAQAGGTRTTVSGRVSASTSAYSFQPDETSVWPGTSDSAQTRSIAGSASRRVGASGHSTRHVSTFNADERARRRRRNIVLVAIISALLTIGITSGIVLLVTHGEGTDSAVPVLKSNQSQNTPSDNGSRSNGDSAVNNQNSQQDNSADSGTPSESGSSSNSSGSTGSNSYDSNTSGSTGSTNSGSTNSGTTSGSTGSTSGSTSGTQSGSASSGSNSGSTSSSTSGSTSSKKDVSGSTSDSGTTSSGASSGTSTQGSGSSTSGSASSAK